MNILHFKELESTNKYAKELAKAAAPEFTVIVADRQSGGYGRMGRCFHSPEASGLYMSIILRPKIKPDEALLITTAAAVAVSQAIEKTADITTSIKWVNDIFLNEKKVCGILTEAGYSGNGSLDYAVLGIGINIYTPKDGFPPDIKDIAGSIFDSPKDMSMRDSLAQSIVNEFNAFYTNLLSKPHLDSYKKRSAVTGKEITVIQGDNSYKATAIDIDNDFRLIVRKSDNTLITLESGEISIRM